MKSRPEDDSAARDVAGPTGTLDTPAGDVVRLASGAGTDDSDGSAGLSERQRAVRNVGWSAVQKWFVRLAGMATFVVLGRLLAPGEIGLAAIAGAAVGFLGVIADFGMSSFLVQHERPDRRTTSTVFWTVLALGAAGAAALVAGADVLAGLLGEPRAAQVIRVLALGLVLTTANCVPAALLVRDLRFRTMAAQSVVAAVVSAAVGIGFALAGAGVWALVLQNLVQHALTLVWFWLACGWRPAFTVSLPVLRAARRWGTAMIGITLLQGLRDRADQFLVGGLGGVEMLGLWSVAARVLGVVHEVTMSVMDHVALPLFVRVREDAERFGRAYETAVAMSTALLAPAVAVLAVVSPVVIPALFGPQWGPSGPTAQVLTIAYGVGAVGYFNRSALLAHGRAGTAWVLAAVGLLVHAAAVVVSVGHGLTALALGVGVATAVLAVVSAVALRTAVGVGARAYGRAVLALLAAAASVGPMWWVSSRLDGLTGAALVAVVGLAGYALAMWLVNRRLLLEALADLRGLLAR